jgi:hypothetical protein
MTPRWSPDNALEPIARHQRRTAPLAWLALELALLVALAACDDGGGASMRDAGHGAEPAGDSAVPSAMDGGVHPPPADGGGLLDAAPGDAGPMPPERGPHWEEVATLSPAEVVRVSWSHRPGAFYSLDVRGTDGTWLGPCVDSALLRGRLSWEFDGRCPSAAGADLRAVDRMRICSSVPSGSDTWDPGSVECTEAPYPGGASLHIATAEDLSNTVVLRWSPVPAASYALHLTLKNGARVDNCAGADVLGRATSFAFRGTCPSQPALGVVALADVARYTLDFAAGSHWENPAARGSAQLEADGLPGDHTLEFAGYRSWVDDERCGVNGAADYRFGEGVTLSAETCTSPADDGYQKRRLPQRDQYKVAAYPRSYQDTDGTTFVLFATPPGGFSPAGNAGCSELNLLVTRNWLDYEVTQIERLCGYPRLDNGELTVIDGKLYVTYHTITGNGGCTAAGDVPGREWVIRLKVSANYRDKARTFTDLAGAPGHDAVKSLCLPNASNDGFWEPMVYQAGDGSLRVAYTDDTPPELGDGQCNQYIRVIHYSESEQRALSDEPVGDCPGDKRDGMPVVMRADDGSYTMVIESLGAPSSQVVALHSADGLTFGPRQVVADTAVDGGEGVGCPYLAFDGSTPYFSFYQTFTTESGAKLGAFRVRSLDANGQRRADRLFELRRHWDAADDLDILYWGSIRLMDGRLHAVASSWSHPFAEAWLPLAP